MEKAKNVLKIHRRHFGDQESDNNDEGDRYDDEMLAGDDHVKERS